MFGGFGLFGAGIGTGFFGKVISNAKNKIEEANNGGRKREAQTEDQESETDEGNIENIP